MNVMLWVLVASGFLGVWWLFSNVPALDILVWCFALAVAGGALRLFFVLAERRGANNG
jgi:hypothetical protein